MKQRWQQALAILIIVSLNRWSALMARKPTINDIARLAGVSKATVSRVLNHKPDVEAATRSRILRIVEEQAFIPSIAATGLAGGRSRLIGVLVPSFTWPFTVDVVRG